MMALGRRAQFNVKDRVLYYPEIYMEFEIGFNTDSDGNVGTIKLYNLSDATIGLLKKGQSFVLAAGYKDDIGVILPGVINKAETTWEETDKITSLVVGDKIDVWSTATINQSWRAGISASEVLKDITKSLPIPIGDLKITSDLVYSRGKTFSGLAKKALEELAADLGMKLHISRGKLYFRPKGEGGRERVILNSDTGLVERPLKIEPTGNQKQDTGDRFQVKSLLNYRIEADTVIDIQSKVISGLWRVDKGKHRSDEWITEMEVVKNGT